MEFDPKVQSRWLMALVSSAISAGVLFSRFAYEHVGFLVIPISIAGSLAGLLLGVLSLLAKEKKRIWAVPGILFSLICPYHLIVSLFEAHNQV